MLYPKFTQRYLAAIVFSLIVALGVSTLFLVYSLYLRRSPLLVETLKRTGNAVPTAFSGKSKENQLLNSKFTGQIDRIEETTNLKAIDYNKESDDSIYNETQFNRSDIVSWKTKTNYTDLDDSNYSDTIYIDDFEKNRTNYFKIEKPDFRSESKSDSSVQISYPDFEITTNVRMRKYERIPSYDRKVAVPQQSNLDALYDRNRDSNEHFDIAEDDVDADDFDDSRIYGSGSGDFSDKLFDYDISTGKDFSKDWENQGRLTRYDFQHNRENSQLKNKNSKAKKTKQLKTNGVGKKRRGRKPNRSSTKESKNYRFAINAENRSSDNESRQLDIRLKSEPTARSDTKSHWEIGKDRAKLSRNSKNKKYSKYQNIMITRTTKAPATTQKLGTWHYSSDQKITKPSLRYNERDDEIRVSTQMDNINHEAASRELQMKPATWVETRTRRILGNVRKSEERSRQLLLCEEAGGGELCRMLFKGHPSE